MDQLWSYEEKVTKTISVKNIYETDSPDCPEGYEFTGEFRPPKFGEYFRNAWGGRQTPSRDYDEDAPRLILRRKLTLADKWQIEPLMATRQPKPGEFFIGGSYIRKVGKNDRPSGDYLILTPAPGFTPVQDEDYRIW